MSLMREEGNNLVHETKPENGEKKEKTQNETQDDRNKVNKMTIFKPYNFRKRCLVCNKNKPNTNEHVFPKWMMKLTNSLNAPIAWFSEKPILGRNCKFPICGDCNKSFNEELEKPFQPIFQKIKNGVPITDQEVEITVRWMWKITQLFYLIFYKNGDVLWSKTLREKCLNAVEHPRYRISLALALTINDVANGKEVEPLGLDVFPLYDTLLSAGVFSNVSIITFNSYYRNFIPPEYAIYTLGTNNNNEGVLIANPSFKNSNAAILKTIVTANKLLPLHDAMALDLMKISGVKTDSLI